MPYGTHAWKVFKYDLWDAKQNRACKCDAMWTGNDCSLRKCPFGDDPLTIVSYDPETEGTTGSAMATSGTSGTALYTGYSPYRQKAERQTLEIDSFHRPNSGTFSLTFTDEYGDEWTTRPIPMVVRLSQTLKTAVQIAHTSLDFGNDPGIHKSEVSIGDIIRIGNSYRLVTKLEYRLDDNNVLDTSLQYYQKIHFTTQMGFAAGAAKAQQTAYGFRKAGTPVYRVTVAKEIREALKALPNDRITDVTVEAITRGGHVLEGTFDDADGGVNLTHTGTLTKRDLLPGDIIRFADEYRVIQSHDDPKYKLDSPLSITPDISNSAIKGYKQNGMKYDITFEQGCRTHEDR